MITYVKLLLMAVFWGGTFIAGRVIARDVQPFSAAFARFVIASALLLLLTWRVEGRLPGIKRGHIAPLILLGITGVFGYNVFFFKGLQTVGAGRASVIVATNPICITLSLRWERSWLAPAFASPRPPLLVGAPLACPKIRFLETKDERLRTKDGTQSSKLPNFHPSNP